MISECPWTAEHFEWMIKNGSDWDIFVNGYAAVFEDVRDGTVGMVLPEQDIDERFGFEEFEDFPVLAKWNGDPIHDTDDVTIGPNWNRGWSETRVQVRFHTRNHTVYLKAQGMWGYRREYGGYKLTHLSTGSVCAKGIDDRQDVKAMAYIFQQTNVVGYLTNRPRFIQPIAEYATAENVDACIDQITSIRP